MKLTKTQKVTNALKKSALTAAQIASRFDVPNVRAMIYDLKRKNFNVVKTVSNSGTTRFSIAGAR